MKEKLNGLTFILHPSAFILSLHRPLECGRSDERGDEHHYYDRAEGGRVDDGDARAVGAGEPERRAYPGEYQPDLAARNHPEAHGEAFDAAADDAERASLLAEYGHESQHRGEAENLDARERPQVNLQTHQHKKYWHEQRAHGREQLRHSLLAAHDELFEVYLV